MAYAKTVERGDVAAVADLNRDGGAHLVGLVSRMAIMSRARLQVKKAQAYDLAVLMLYAPRCRNCGVLLHGEVKRKYCCRCALFGGQRRV